jgi:hypothetical protein
MVGFDVPPVRAAYAEDLDCVMLGKVLNFVGKPDHFKGNWGDRTAKRPLNPDKGWRELLRFAALILRDQQKVEVSTDEILDCIRIELKVGLSPEETRQIQSCLMTHPSFVAVTSDRYAIT